MSSSSDRNSLRLTRRSLISQAPWALSYAALSGRALAQSAEPEYVEAKTTYGRVRGVKSPGLATFKGIPYGGSVSGANRFKAAPALKPWTAVRDAIQFGAPALQPGQRRNEPAQDEDCLFLNIWTPAADGKKRPVMFYSHGGGFTSARPHLRTRTAPALRVLLMWWSWRPTTASA